MARRKTTNRPGAADLTCHGSSPDPNRFDPKVFLQVQSTQWSERLHRNRVPYRAVPATHVRRTHRIEAL